MVQQEITGDVGQVAGQDMINARSHHRLSNTVNIRMSDAAKPKTITELQRKAIAAKINEIEKKAVLNSRAIYGNILKDFGLYGIRDLPRDQYKVVMATLEQYLSPIKEEASLFCPHCTKENKQIKQMRFGLGAICAFLLVVGAKTLWVSTSNPMTSDAIHPMKYQCTFEGRNYSVGSLIMMPGYRQCECIFNLERGFTHWVTAKPEN